MVPRSGIVLNTTGTLGGLTVSGTGSAGSGGTIQKTTGNAVSLNVTQNVSLNRMNITNNLGSGVFGDDVTNFTIADSSVTNNGDTQNGTEAGLRFNELLGTSAITNTTITGSSEDNIRMTPSSGTLTLGTREHHQFLRRTRGLQRPVAHRNRYGRRDVQRDGQYVRQQQVKRFPGQHL